MCASHNTYDVVFGIGASLLELFYLSFSSKRDFIS